MEVFAEAQTPVVEEMLFPKELKGHLGEFYSYDLWASFY